MKMLFSYLALLLALTSFAPAPASMARPRQDRQAGRIATTVYVCMSKSSVAYHSSDKCAGLNRCNHEVKQVSTSEAQGLGKRTCMKCY